MLISKGTMLSGLCWITQPFQPKSFAGGWEQDVVYVSKTISAHLGHVALGCLSRSVLLARSLFCRRTQRWHKTSPYFLDKDCWGVMAYDALWILFLPLLPAVCFILTLGILWQKPLQRRLYWMFRMNQEATMRKNATGYFAFLLHLRFQNTFKKKVYTLAS